MFERFRGYTLLEVRPQTGRSHQIRVHVQAIGHPLAIDPLYGSSEPLLLSALKPSYRPKAGAVEHPLMARLTLHAQALELSIRRMGNVHLGGTPPEGLRRRIAKPASLPSSTRGTTGATTSGEGGRGGSGVLKGCV